MVGDGTDAFVNERNPSVLFWFGRTRKSKFAGVLGSNLVLTPEQSLRYHTINAAYMSVDEDKIGSIEVGKLADLVIISEDILTCPVDSIFHMEVLATMVGGNTVYER